MDILREYDPNMDPAGADEAYAKYALFPTQKLLLLLMACFSGSITEYCTAHSVNPEDCVQEIRTRIFQDTKLTASAGIAANKMLAKVRSYLLRSPSCVRVDKEVGVRYVRRKINRMASLGCRMMRRRLWNS